MEGALAEPLSVAMHAARRAQVGLPHTPRSVLIFGAGTIGLLCAAVCKASGASKIQIADVQTHRVEFATTHKFANESMTIPLRKPTSLEENLAVAKETADEACRACRYQSKTFTGFDVVFECTGVEACTQAAIYVSIPTARRCCHYF